MAGMWITRLGIKAHESKSFPQVTLRSDIWSSLPDDVLDTIIARLPLQSLVRMTSVCKKWKIKLRTPSFIRQCELERDSSNEWFLTFGQHKTRSTVAFAYDIHLSKWHNVPLGFLPLETVSPLAAADGLLCLRGSSPRSLLVCNPLSRFWRDVPLPPHVDPTVISLVVDRVSGTYKLVIVDNLVAFVFGSQSLAWKSYESDLTSVVCSAVCEGMLYCLTARPYELHAFNVVAEEWTRVTVSLPAEVFAPSLVARSSGRLFLVDHMSNNVGIWALDHETQRWNVVDILLETTRVSSPRTLNLNHEIVFVKWSSRFLAYNVSKQSWQWLPSAQGSHTCHHGFLFTPSLLLP